MSLFLAHYTTSLSIWWWVENLVRDSRSFMETRVMSLSGAVYCLIAEKSSLS